MEKFDQNFVNVSNVLRQNISKNYSFLKEQSYLLGVFMGIASEVCEKNTINAVEEKQEVSWSIRLEQPLKYNPKLVASIYKMCGAGSFTTKLRKPDGSIHPSPCLSRAPFCLMGKYLFFLTGPNINVYPKEKLVSYLMDGKNQTVSCQFISQQPQQFYMSSEAHSIVVAPFLD